MSQRSPGEFGVGVFKGRLRARDLEDRRECFLGEVRCVDESPRASLGDEVVRAA